MEIEAPEKMTDQEWVRLIKQDDPTALKELWAYLYKIAIYKCNDVMIAEDIVSDTLHLIRTERIYKYRFQGSFHGYCRTILVRAIYRVRAENKRKLQFEIPLFEETLDSTIEQIELKQDQNTVRAKMMPCLKKLNRREYDSLMILYEHDLVPEVGARKLKVSRNNFNQIAHRARKKMERCLKLLGHSSTDEFIFL